MCCVSNSVGLPRIDGQLDEGFGPTKGAPWRAGANESTSIAFSTM